MANKQTGGVNISGRKVSVGGDAVGRDKFEEHVYVAPELQEEKGSCLLFIERASVFIFTMLVAGAMLGGLGALIAAAVGGQNAWVVGAALGALLGLAMAIANAGNISRYRQP